MYHERGLKQPQIAVELHVSQPRVSRLLRQAVELGVVRTTVTLPPGVYTDLEDQVRERYGLRDVVVVDAGGTAGEVLPALGAAAAQYLDATLTGREVLGISSWSETLIATVDAMRVKNTPVVEQVVQLTGGVGNPQVQVQATRLTSNLARLTGAAPVFMPSPGFVGSAAIRRALMKEASIAEVAAVWKTLTMVLVGIGSLEPSPLLRRSGNAIAEGEQQQLRKLGAVGDVCHRYFDADGQPVAKFDQRVVGIGASELRAVDRRVAVAGGERKFSCVRAALRGGWINVLITDLAMATRLADTEDGAT
jgi:DNA-binding transcriptional regulator LsrR (DeoR family)